MHRATDLRLHRPVAVKIFRPDTDPRGAQRFRDEARTLANLADPGLVAVHDFDVQGPRAYLVMELIEGSTLREVFDREHLPLPEITRIGAEVAGVLARVHEQGVVHLDVKPSNILFDRDGRVRLADFGISRLLGATGMTSAQEALGTPAYMAPEQVQGHRPGPAADVYALGLVLIEALTGQPEYPGGGWETAAERLTRRPAVPAGLSTGLGATLRAMTETEPARRPTAREVARRLAGEGVGVPPVAAPPERDRTLVIGLGLVALLAVLVAIVLATTGDEEPPAPAGPTTSQEPGGERAPEPGGADPGSSDAEDPGPGDSAPDPDPQPGFPDFEAPDLPDVPEMPELPTVPDSVREDAGNAWQRFTEWFTRLF